MYGEDYFTWVYVKIFTVTLPGRNACRPVVGITWGSHFFLSIHLNDGFIEQRSRRRTNYAGAARTGLSETNLRFTVQDISPDKKKPPSTLAIHCLCKPTRQSSTERYIHGTQGSQDKPYRLLDASKGKHREKWWSLFIECNRKNNSSPCAPSVSTNNH